MKKLFTTTILLLSFIFCFSQSSLTGYTTHYWSGDLYGNIIVNPISYHYEIEMFSDLIVIYNHDYKSPNTKYSITSSEKKYDNENNNYYIEMNGTDNDGKAVIILFKVINGEQHLVVSYSNLMICYKIIVE